MNSSQDSNEKTKLNFQRHLMMAYFSMTIVSFLAFRCVVGLAIFYAVYDETTGDDSFDATNSVHFALSSFLDMSLLPILWCGAYKSVRFSDRYKPHMVIFAYTFLILDTIGLAIVTLFALEQDHENLPTGHWIRFSIDIAYLFGIPLCYGFYLCCSCIRFTCKAWWKSDIVKTPC